LKQPNIIPALFGNRLVLLCLLMSACSYQKLTMPSSNNKMSGYDFYKKVVTFQGRARDSFAINAILKGEIPSFYKKFTKVHTQIVTDKNKIIRAKYFVARDYLVIGNNKDWARIPLTPMAAQKIADSLHCFLPTTKMVEEIYTQSKVKLEPIPIYAFRDSTITMWQHHLMIEALRKGKGGLISGIKKDVVLSNKTIEQGKTNRVAIYGWHQLNGVPIQPLYAGHINSYVDYSHGIRLVMDKIKVNGKWMHYTSILRDPLLRKLLTNEQDPIIVGY
jgi:hypothetical protein